MASVGKKYARVNFPVLLLHLMCFLDKTTPACFVCAIQINPIAHSWFKNIEISSSGGQGQLDGDKLERRKAGKRMLAISNKWCPGVKTSLLVGRRDDVTFFWEHSGEKVAVLNVND